MNPAIWVEDGPTGRGRRQGLILPRREALSPKLRHGKCGGKAKQIEVLASSRSCRDTVIQSVPGHWSLWLPRELVAWPCPAVGEQARSSVSCLSRATSPHLWEQAPPLQTSRCACDGGGLPCPRSKASLFPRACRRLGRPSLAGRGGAPLPWDPRQPPSPLSLSEARLQ